MKFIILGYFFIGALTNIYYHSKNSHEYARMLQSGEVDILSFIIGGVLTVFLWPLAIFNNEFRGKK